MKRKEGKVLLALLLATLVVLAGGLPAGADMPKNVILMIGDGQGCNTVAATDYYTGNNLVYESFPVQAGVSTFSEGTKKFPDNYQFQTAQGGYDPTQAWTDFNYIKSGATDSASAATALATGVKNLDGQLNVDVFQQNLTNIVQLASAAGKATGVVTTVEFSHATPAGMVAHNVSRNNYAQIAIEMYNSDLDVIMGCGNPDFDDNGLAASKNAQYVGGATVWSQLKNPGDGYFDDWTLIQTEAAFESLADSTYSPATDKLLGVAQVYTTLQQARSPAVSAGSLKLPYEDPLNPDVPTLEVMSEGALNFLKNYADGKENGFFLMIEGGAVDWANHANQMGRMIEEQMDFNASVQAVVDWVNKYSNWNDTLLIVTADHETGGLWGKNSGPGSQTPFAPLVDNGKGNLPDFQYNSGDHTNSLVPVYAKGKGAFNLNYFADQKDPVRGKYVDNTEIFHVMMGDVPWKTYEYSYVYLADESQKAAYLANPKTFDGCDFYTGTVYAPLSKGYFVGEKMDMGQNETGKNGVYIVTGMDPEAQSMGKLGRVLVDNYHDAGRGNFAPTGGNSPKGWNYLGSETGYIVKSWYQVYKFGKAKYSADALPFYSLPSPWAYNWDPDKKSGL